ncbi:hypothetical protein [Polaromonas sp. A23]|uniref:hypothetical protein n=1 Tax=Polaromonas sp. A23 TaxID=1944133 RepID=UPI000986BDF5|nr:hypothetical protein [Polaromonas sp. A23]OOG35834.1 hypothetical protein B0B52_21185 [Polaromonas sp. A23]
MKTTLLAFSLALATAAFTLPAHAVGSLADVTVIDRHSGATLPVYRHRGEYWVAGQYGAKYSIMVRNRLGERVLAVTTVDGVNVLSGETAAWEQTGYVFSPWQQYAVTGWRKSSSEVAAFEFSGVGNSYAGRTGRPGNVGVIGVALFRERLPEPVAQAPAYSRREESRNDFDGRLRGAPVPSPAPASPSAAGSAGLADRSASESSAQAERAPSSADSLAKSYNTPPAAPRPAPQLGTAHGQRETSVVSHTSFARLQAQPNEIIRIRYDSRENLVAAGIIREPVVQLPVPNPFPQSGNTTYVPDPY